MAKRKKTTPIEPTQPAPIEESNANGGGDDPKWQRMQSPSVPTETPAGEQGQQEDAPVSQEGPKQPEVEKTFTQTELEHQLAERVKRERSKYSDYKDLQAKAKKLDEIEREQMDEVERLKLEAEEAKAQAAQATQQVHEQQINNAILTAITEFQTDKNVTFRPDATQAALKLVDLSNVKIDGNDVTGVTEAIQALANEHSFLLQQPQTTIPTSPTNPARTTPQGTTDDERRLRYYGGGQGDFFKNRDGGVVYPE